jgi:ABC-type hemin transport system substrate-binding protein
MAAVSGRDYRTIDVQTSLNEVGQPVKACLHPVQLASEYCQQIHRDGDWEANVADQRDKSVHVVPPWQGAALLSCYGEARMADALVASP